MDGKLVWYWKLEGKTNAWREGPAKIEKTWNKYAQAEYQITKRVRRSQPFFGIYGKTKLQNLNKDDC